jgi:hypothetical protein
VIRVLNVLRDSVRNINAQMKKKMNMMNFSSAIFWGQSIFNYNKHINIIRVFDTVRDNDEKTSLISCINAKLLFRNQPSEPPKPVVLKQNFPVATLKF